MHAQSNTDTTQAVSSPDPNSAPKNDDVIFEHHQNLCKVILNRPKALNALTADMIKSLDSEVRSWESNPDLKVDT